MVSNACSMASSVHPLTQDCQPGISRTGKSLGIPKNKVMDSVKVFISYKTLQTKSILMIFGFL